MQVGSGLKQEVVTCGSTISGWRRVYSSLWFTSYCKRKIYNKYINHMWAPIQLLDQLYMLKQICSRVASRRTLIRFFKPMVACMSAHMSCCVIQKNKHEQTCSKVNKHTFIQTFTNCAYHSYTCCATVSVEYLSVSQCPID